ncbi:MAG: L,D-transpeptidase [Firmicutes bacterium]|nr:L,D-transpeptidase [Bacillota bacterium]
MKNNISKKAKLIGMLIAMAVSSFNSVEACANELEDKEVVMGDTKIDKKTYVKALEDINIYDSVECNNVIGTLEENKDLPFNCLWDEGFYEVKYNDSIGFVECNKCNLISKYNFVNMVEFMNDCTMYVEDNNGVTSVVNVEKQAVGGLVKTVGSWSLVYMDDTLGYVKSDNLRTLSDSFVVVDESDLMLYLYQDCNLILEAPVITGRKNHETDQGDFKVYDKKTGYKMHGVDQDTGKPYEAYVDYCVMYNKEHQEYIHDASWRSEADFENRFELPNIRSHGCVNAKKRTAQTVYNVLDKGDDAIVRP